MPRTANDRLELLKSAPLGSWIALSADETRIVASGKNLIDVVRNCEAAGEQDPIMLKTPSAWAPRFL